MEKERYFAAEQVKGYDFETLTTDNGNVADTP